MTAHLLLAAAMVVGELRVLQEAGLAYLEHLRLQQALPQAPQPQM